MSYPILPIQNEDLVQGLPSYSRFDNTLLLIQTIKFLPNHSFTSLNPQELQQSILEEEDSLGAKVKQSQPVQLNLASPPDAKKKKTGCTCKKTNCLKRYCECFSSGKLCTPECSCCDCFNQNHHEELIKRTNSFIKSKSSRKNHQGCTCRKSQCQKKYCECFNAGLKCTSACKCRDCENMSEVCSHHSHPQSQYSLKPQQKEKEVDAKIFCAKSIQSLSNMGFISGLDL